MKISNVLFLGASLLLAASSTALADGDGDGSGSATVGAGAEVSAGGAGAAASGEATVGADGDMVGGWPAAAIDRPYTLPASGLAVNVNLSVLKISIGGASATGVGLGLGAGYGISDKLTVGAQYGLSLKEFEAKGPLTIYGEFKLAHTSKLSVAASASFTANLASDPVSKGINAGLGLLYKVAPKIAIFTGAPFGPGPVGQHLSISLDSGGPISLDIPVGVELQATPQLAAYVSTQLAHFKISGDANANAFIGADFFPLTLGGLMSINKNIDVNAFFALPDLKNAKFDLFILGAGLVYYK